MRSIKKIIKFFNIENNSPVKKNIFFFLLFISISGTIFSLLSNYINFYFDFDQYKLITAAESISKNKLGGLPYFPNSSTGADIFYWPYIFTPLFYSLLLDYIPNLYNFYFIFILEFLIAVFVLIIFLKKLLKYLNVNENIVYIFFIILFFSPLFNQYFIGVKSTYRWCFIFSMLSIYFLFNLFDRNKTNHKRSDLFFCGFFSSLSPMAFISVGLPIFFGIQISFFIQNFFINIKNNPKKIVNFSIFFFGSLIPIFLLIIYFTNFSNTYDFQNLYKLFFYYSGEAIPNTIGNFFIKYGYFISSLLITSYVQVSFMPIFILSLIINLILFKNLNTNQKILIRTLTVFFVSWLILAIPFSTHIYATRMAILYPLFICSFINIFLFKFKDKRIFNFFIFSTVFIFILQILFTPILKNYDIKLLIIPATLVLIVFVLFYFLHKSKSKLFIQKNFYINGLFYFFFIFFLLKIFYFKISHLKNFYLDFQNLNSQSLFNVSDIYTQLTKKKIEKYLVNNDTVLTNKPYSYFFPNNALQALYSYRIFFGGVKQEPADKIFLFFNNNNKNISFFEKKLEINSIIYFKGFYYKILEENNLYNNEKFFYGEKINYSKNVYIKPIIYIPKENIIKYFDWRSKNIQQN